MDSLQIKLRTDRQIYHDLYFRHNYASFWLYGRKRIIAFIIFFILLIVAGMAALLNGTDLYLYVFAGVALLTIVSLLVLLKRWRIYATWKKPLVSYINTISGYNTYILMLNQASIEFIINGASFIEKWDNFTQCTIFPDYLSIGDTDTPGKYLFAAKAMRPMEYEELKSFVRSMIHKS
jgi:hypothetical protein